MSAHAKRWRPQRRGRRQSPRVALRQKVHAATGSGTADEFVDRLRGVGVSFWPRMSDRAPGEVTGYSVSLGDWTNAAGEPVRFGGGKLAPDLNWPKLRARWEPTDPPASSRPAAGPDEQTWRLGPLDGDDAQRAWQEAERIVRDAADRINRDAATDPYAAADGA